MRERRVLSIALATTLIASALFLVTAFTGFREASFPLPRHDVSLAFLLATYAGVSAVMGVFAPQIAKAVRGITRKRRVVVAHHLGDEEYVKGLSDELARFRVYTWSDLNDVHPGDDIVLALQEQIRDADGVILFSSPDTPDYDAYVTGLAEKNNVRLIPIVERDAEESDLVLNHVPIYLDSPVPVTAKKIANALRYGSSSRFFRPEQRTEKQTSESADSHG
jgi:hypothetical protein